MPPSKIAEYRAKPMNPYSRHLTLSICMLCAWTLLAQNLRGEDYPDRIKLRSGAELRVNILTIADRDNGSFVVFKTESGATVKLQRKLIASVLESGEEYEAYKNHLKTRVETVGWHEEIVDWCKSQPRGRIYFKDEIRYHLEMIVGIDPDNVRARKLLGYERVGPGQWMLENLLLDRYGYEANGAKITPRIYRLIDESQNVANQNVGEFKKKFNLWQRDVRLGRGSVAEFQQRLFELCTVQTAYTIFEEHAKTEKSPALRSLYIEALGKAPCRASTGGLSWFAVNDPSPGLRERSTVLLGQPSFDQQLAMNRISEFVANPDNGVINSAGNAIKELSGDNSNAEVREVMLRLTDALVTEHQVSTGASGAGGIQASFNDSGLQSFTAGDQPTTVPRRIQNRGVLEALKKMTGKNFGFNKRRWEQFFVENYSLKDATVRADE